MKAMLVAIQPKWLRMILEGKKKFEFRNWKVPVGTVLYFYCTKVKPYLSSICTHHTVIEVDDKDFGELNGKVVAKAVVKDVDTVVQENLYDSYYYSKEKVQRLGTCDDFVRQGYTDQTYALELDQVEEIEPKDVTEFVSWNKFSDYYNTTTRGYLLEKATFEEVKRYLDKKSILYKPIHLTKPPQSRTWIYTKE